jgi:CubicO group peptidase (beta-lactamase class C family)
MSFWNANLRRLMDEALVPGAAAAIIRNGDITELASHGVRLVESLLPVDAYTVFDAASLSKPVFAYLALQLMDRGKLSLDTLLASHLADYIRNDPRAASVTVAHGLSHSAGFPNWRNLDYPLRTYFQPGERFSYSGEGYLYLQRVIESMTGETLESLARRLVFEPLGMNFSSFIWDARFQENRAYPHDAFGAPALGYKPGEANAAWSLQTCAADYARFLVGVLDGSRLHPDTAQLWLKPHVHIMHAGIQCLGLVDADVATDVAWGLGWGLEPKAGTFFHWGDNGPFTAFTLGSIEYRAALVVFLNGASGLSIMPEIVAQLVPGERPSLKWLDYVSHDAPVRRLLRATLETSIQSVWPEFESAALPREELIWIAQGLAAKGRQNESIWLRERADPK